MSNWSEQQFTRKGAELRAKVEAGKCKLALTKMKIGNGSVTVGEIEHMTDLKSPQLVFGISSCTVSEEDSTVCKTVGIASSSNVENSFSVSEMGLYATDPDIGEILYLVCIDSAPDTMPNKRVASPVTLTYQFDIVTSNTANVTAMITPTGLATAKMVNEHRTAAELDHPNKSVHKKHLAFEVYDKGEVDTRLGGKANSSHGNHIPNPEAANNARFLRNDNTWQAVTPGNIGAYAKTETYSKSESYNKGEVDSRANTKVNKSGDTMTGTLNVPRINFEFGYIENGARDTGDAIAGNGGANVNIASWHGLGFYDKSNSRYTGTMNLRNGDWRTIGAMTATTFYANDWFRAKGDSGFYFQDHGGGWYMQDSDWIRAHGNKHIYTGGKMKADGGFEGKASSAGWADSAGNSNTLAGQSLQWILDKINAAKTGIVAGNLDENGWVKFANGLIVQWGAVKRPNKSVNFPLSFPSMIFQLLYTTELHFNEVPDGTWFRLKNKTVSGAEWLALTATDRFYIAIGR
ncbi:shufflon system plasmid conjugative transfer pilus tip adhesin PilV [uncultured Selenomonas sp.]|uniref:shufflon system plasmid conjugative transfer pilus tip adhesin PilV n=1 Tax=uncultured Selenomonas sp. TaxID=159275 RepID=UPI0028E3FCC9|nr:shufflon system plasmid conjugative transfer pilus tip adhesin PilV [uncultured Selenomonas sp.]